VITFVTLQLAFVVRAYWAPHHEFGYQMFPEATQWQAEIVRVRPDGTEISIREPWAGYEWNALVTGRGLSSPWRRHHADAGVDNQLEFLGEALTWVADHTDADDETSFLEARVTVWFTLYAPTTTILRSPERDLP
jgi:hypothetical protein